MVEDKISLLKLLNNFFYTRNCPHGEALNLGGFRLAREHVSDAGGREDAGRKHSVLMGV